MFAIIATWALGLTAAALAVHWLVFVLPRRKVDKAPRDVRRYGRWERLVHLAAVVSFLVLAGTGFWASLCTRQQMTGYVLMAHVTFGGIFAVCLVLAILTWAEDHHFAGPDAQRLRHWGQCLAGRGGLPAERFSAGQKMFFWAFALGGTVVVVSPALSMLDLFGTAGQEVLYEVHRWAALVLTIVTILHAYATTLGKPGTYRSMISGRVSREWASRYHPDWQHEAPRGRA